MDKVLLTVQESLQFAKDSAYWEGYAAGVAGAASHAKQLLLNKIVQSRNPTPPPTQSASELGGNSQQSGVE